MTTLITDGGRYEISKKVTDLLRSLFIKQHESEPYHQHQNKAEQSNRSLSTPGGLMADVPCLDRSLDGC